MPRYVLGRIAQALVTMWMVVSIVFVLGRFSGDPVALLAGPNPTPEFEAQLRKNLGLDQPLWQQYLTYMARLVQGDLGVSIITRKPAMTEVLNRWPATLEIGLASLIFTLSLALPIGVYAAVRRGTRFDAAARGFAVLGQSVPAFWLGLLFIFIFAGQLKLMPAGGRGGVEHVLLPAVTLGWFAVAGVMRVTRSSMLEVLGSEYVKLARAKGLPDRLVFWKHAFRNAAIPILTFTALVGTSLFLAGSIVAETVFSYPGVASLVIEAVRQRDFPQMQAAVLFLSLLYVFVNLTVDILYGYLDPRIRY